MKRRFTLIGPGRAGLSIHGALSGLGWQCAGIYGRDDDVSGAAADVELCIIATPDASIRDVSASVKPGEAVVMHLSGATPLSVLDGHNATAALHPLQSLPNAEVGAASLRGCYFAVAGDPIAQQLADELSGKWFVIADADRALYHAAAVVASNHTVALIGQVNRLAASIGVPLEAFGSMVSTSVRNAFDHGPASALTGPVKRGDDATIEAHREVLARSHPGELAGYDAMVELARRLVEQSNRAQDPKHNSMDS